MEADPAGRCWGAGVAFGVWVGELEGCEHRPGWLGSSEDLGRPWPCVSLKGYLS